MISPFGISLIVAAIILTIGGVVCILEDEAQRLNSDKFFWAGVVCFILVFLIIITLLVGVSGTCTAGIAGVDYTLVCGELQ